MIKLSHLIWEASTASSRDMITEKSRGIGSTSIEPGTSEIFFE